MHPATPAEDIRLSAIVHFGEVQTPAMWQMAGECLELQVVADNLPLADQKTLHSYRSAREPLLLQLPKGPPRRMLVIGYDAVEEIYYLTPTVTSEVT